MKNFKTDDKGNHFKGVKCHEYEGYGHIKTKYATFLKKQKKSLTISWPDEDISDKDIEYEPTKRVTTLLGEFILILSHVMKS